MENVERKKSLDERVSGVKSAIIGKIIKIVIVIFVLVILFFPFKKAELDDTVILINPITLVYYAVPLDDNGNIADNNHKLRGIASKSIQNEKKYYIVNFESINIELFDEKGNINFWAAVKACIFI